MRKTIIITSLLALLCVALFVFKSTAQDDQMAAQNKQIAQALAQSEFASEQTTDQDTPVSLPDALPNEQPVQKEAPEEDEEPGSASTPGVPIFEEDTVTFGLDDVDETFSDDTSFSNEPITPGKITKDTLSGTVKGFLITEYAPAREEDFSGALVAAPGLSGKHKADWLYSSRGIMMEGDGIGLDGRLYHLESGFGRSWVTKEGKSTTTSGAPYWTNSAYWKNAKGKLTIKLSSGWSNGVGVNYIKPSQDIRFSEGQSRSLQEYRSIAVDPNIIPMGSKVYIPAYKNSPNKGWFIAEDTGTAIKGKHIDVYRTGSMTTHKNQTIKIILP